MIAVLAAIIWVLGTSANPENSWDPVNLVVRVAAGTVTIAAAAEWLVLSLRENRRTGDRVADPVHVLPATRSAGSRTVCATVLAPRDRRRTAAQDLATVADGGAVLVVAYLMERKVRRVVLRVGLDQGSAQSLASALGSGPHRVFGTQPPTRGLFDRSAYTQVEGASQAGAWSVSVPTPDVDVLRYVLARTGE